MNTAGTFQNTSSENIHWHVILRLLSGYIFECPIPWDFWKCHSSFKTEWAVDFEINFLNIFWQSTLQEMLCSSVVYGWIFVVFGIKTKWTDLHILHENVFSKISANIQLNGNFHISPSTVIGQQRILSWGQENCFSISF